MRAVSANQGRLIAHFDPLARLTVAPIYSAEASDVHLLVQKCAPRVCNPCFTLNMSCLDLA